MSKKLLALLIIIVLASIMYFISGYSQNNTKVCTFEAKICPDGSSVGRSGPNCEFTPCPTVILKKMCGGFAGTLCPEGYVCDKKENYPDAAGTCIKISPNSKDQPR